MQVDSPDITRLQPTSDSLNIILKNTHFKDDILAADSKIRLKIDYTAHIPVLTFKFPETYYDFLQVLSFKTLLSSSQEWLDKNPIVIKLVLSDTVISDHLSTLPFSLDPVESEYLRDSLNAQKEMSLSQIQETEEAIYLNVNKFLR